jgi:hypothetical protein
MVPFPSLDPMSMATWAAAGAGPVPGPPTGGACEGVDVSRAPAPLLGLAAGAVADQATDGGAASRSRDSSAAATAGLPTGLRAAMGREGARREGDTGLGCPCQGKWATCSCTFTMAFTAGFHARRVTALLVATAAVVGAVGAVPIPIPPPSYQMAVGVGCVDRVGPRLWAGCRGCPVLMWLFCFSWCADTAESLCPPVPPSPQLNISAHWASGIVKAGVMKLYFSPNASLTSIAVTEGNGPSYVCSLSLSRFLVLVCRAHTAPPSPHPLPNVVPPCVLRRQLPRHHHVQQRTGLCGLQPRGERVPGACGF